MENKTQFPYKTLIWAIFGLIAIFLFKKPLNDLLTNAEGVSVFGVEIKASKEKVQKLQDSIQTFENSIAALSDQLSVQQEKINSLDQIKNQLEKDLAECPEAKNTSELFNLQVSQISKVNQDLTTKSNRLVNADILKINAKKAALITFNVKLILPSNMAGADIYVDGKKAQIVKRSGIAALVKIAKKNGSYSFQIKKGSKSCSADRTITKDNIEVPIVCDF